MMYTEKSAMFCRPGVERHLAAAGTALGGRWSDVDDAPQRARR
jgi:hypothetical protein